MILKIIMDFVNSPEFNFDVFCQAEYFGESFSDEFSFELVDKAGIEHDFIITCLL